MAQYSPQQNYGQTNTNSGNPPLDNTPLPAGWEMRIDPGTGWPFYIDHHNQTTSWTDPRKTNMYQSGPQQRPGFREIPIQHENHRQGSYGKQGDPQGGGRPIPIHHEQGRSSPGFRGTPPRQDPGAAWGWQQSGGPGARYPAQGSNTQQNHQQPQHHSREIPIGRSDNQEPPPPTQSATYQAARPAKTASPAGAATGGENAHYSSGPQINKQEADQQEPPPVFPMPPPPAAPTGGLQPPNAAQPRAASPAPQNLSPLEHIQVIIRETEELEKQVNAFVGKKSEKQYKFLEEMLTRKLLKLDDIDSAGNLEIRNERKRGVKLVQGCLDQLELKAFANAQDTGDSNNTSNNSNQVQHKTEGGGGSTQSSGTTDSGKPGAEKTTGVKEMVLDSEINC